MSAGSVLGFAIVFVLAGGALSAVCAALLPRSAGRGAAIERRAAWLAAALPVGFGLAIVGILVGESLIGFDHCPQHDHHAHLCLAHGAAWASRPWAIILVAAAMMLVVVRAAVLAAGVVRAHLVASRLRRVGVASGHTILVESDRVFCFVAGIVKPAIFASTAARASLSDEEWRGMIAHEESHIANRDLLGRFLLELCLVFAAPLAAISIRERWESATERMRDADAGREVGFAAVASALVRMAYSLVPVPARAVASFTPSGDALLSTRVTSLLDETPTGEADATRLVRVVLGASVGVLALVLVFAEPLHHALETLLG